MNVEQLVYNVGDKHAVGPCEKKPDGMVFVSKSAPFKDENGMLVVNTAKAINHDKDIAKQRKAKFGLTGKQYKRTDKAIKRIKKAEAI
jgi:hypothetical protein